jgi:hypothetical protein
VEWIVIYPVEWSRDHRLEWNRYPMPMKYITIILALTLPVAAQTTLTMDSAINLPDATNGPAGEGFTCTGLTTSSAGGFWIMNYGSEDEADVTISSNIVRTATTFAANLQEISLAAFGSGSMQGVTRDTTDNTLWIASNGSQLRQYNESGTLLSGAITISGANGICYDAANDIIYSVTGSGVFATYSPNTQTLIATLTSCPGTGPDHLTMVNGKVWCSAGANGSNGTIWEYDPNTTAWTHIYTLTGATSIEGIDVIGNTLYVANDGYYHNGTPKKNRILLYTVAGDETPRTVTATTVTATTVTIAP